MAWGEVDVDNQRVRFVVAASRRESEGKSLAELCEEFQISRPTGYTWLKRYQEAGMRGVVERSRRPKHCPGQTAAWIEQRVAQLRREKPDWGARKLEVLLKAEGIQLPRVTIHRILLRQGLVRREDRHPPALERFERERPNELWQMDFKGPKWWNRPVGPLSVLDDHSRFAIDLYGTWSTKGELVRERLEGAFGDCGVPEAMLLDHGTPWWDMMSPTGWTWLTVWLMRQGVRVYFSGYRHPQTQGKVERFHRTLEAAIVRRRLPAEAQRQAWLDEFRHEYNYVRPHEALGMRPPASRWRKSERRYQPHPPAWEYPCGAEVRTLNSAGRLYAGNRNWQISEALAGEQVQLVGIEQRILVYYCETLVRELDLDQGQSLPVAALLPASPRSGRLPFPPS
jgi:transposase InsO family protein